MTLLEALEHIRSSEKCDSVAAQVDLKHEIRHRVIPVKWADSEGPDDKPNVSKLQRSQLVLSGPGLALSGQSLRPLLVFRPSVHATWPRTTSKVTTSPEEANSNGARDSAQRKAEEKYEQWMSLVEAIEHIRMSQRCDSIGALRQLKREANDGMVQVQWEDSDGPKDSPDPKYLQGTQLPLIGTGFAPDNVQEIYRPLLVERSAVRELWPLLHNWHKDPSQTHWRSTIQPEKLPRRSVDDDEIRSAARDVYRERENDRPNMPKAERLIRQKLRGGKRDDIRRILSEVEFAGIRRKPGNQPNK